MQLTWPVDKPDNEMRMDHFTHIPFLEAAHASYKRAILHRDNAKLLRTFIRVVLPPMAQPRRERSPLEENIIKVVLHLFRNLAVIEKPYSASAGENDEDISRSATIDAFHRQDVFNLILTFGSGILDEYDLHDVEILDMLFHLVKGIEVETLFMDKDEFMSAQTRELKILISKEKSMLAGYQKNAPSRHARFVPMMWMDRGDGKRSTVVGQRAYMKDDIVIDEMDKNKKWRRPRRPKKSAPEKPSDTFDKKVPLTYSARRHLRQFVEQFLDSSFNPLFTSVRKAIERETERVEERHRRQYFFLVSWFLQAECARRRKAAADLQAKQASQAQDVESFSLVASVLNQETFALLNRSMQAAHDEKEWRDLNAQMRCFTQILLTVYEMTESPLEEDQDIADNILSRLFYEQSTHDRIISVLRSFKDQGFGYLDACTELAHTFLRVLERYAKENADMQVRRIRRVRKKRNEEEGKTNAEADSAATKEMDRQEAERVSTERRFDFPKYATRFINQNSIDTFVSLAKYFKELNQEQLKRAHRFFYRVAFKMELSPYLFRADILLLFQRMVKGPEGLDPECAVYKEWEELTRQVFRRLVKKLQSRPSLSIEVLFSKMPNTVFFLEHGHERVPERRFPRAAAELEVKPGMEQDQQIQVAVSILVNQSKFDILAWVKDKISRAVEERKAWEDASAARTMLSNARESSSAEVTGDAVAVETGPSELSAEPIKIKHDREDIRLALVKDKHVRLFMTVLSFTHQDFLMADPPYAEWTIPASVPTERLSANLDLIAKTEFAPPIFEDGKAPEDLVRRKYIHASQPRRVGEVGSGSDSEGGSIASDLEEGLFVSEFPPDPKEPSKSRPPKDGPRRSRHKKDELLDDEVLEERRAARRRLERERAQKIKSNLYISRSDDESDDERDRAFFEMEKRLATKTARNVVQAQRRAKEEMKEKAAKKGNGRKRKSDAFLEDEGESSADESNPSEPELAPRAKRSRLAELLADDDDNMMAPDDDDPEDDDDVSSADSEDDLDVAVGEPASRRKKTMRGPFVDSDSEEENTDTPPSSERPSSGYSVLQEISKAADPNDSESDISGDAGGGSDKENAGGSAQRSLLGRRALKVIEDDDDDEE